MTKLTSDQKKDCREAMLAALREQGFAMSRQRWLRWVLIVSSIRMRYLRLGGYGRRGGGRILTDFLTDGKVFRSKNGVPYSVLGGTFLVFCTFYDGCCSSAWALRINITPDADLKKVAEILGNHNFYSHRGGI